MPLGVIVQTRTAPPPRGAPTDTGTLFVAGKAGTGPTDKAVEARSINDVAGAFGARVTANQRLYDYLDNYFREDGNRALIARYPDTETVDDALALFPKDKGPGQITVTDETPEPDGVLYSKLLDHAEQNNRFAVCDVDNGDTLSDMAALGDAWKAIDNNDYGMLVGPWVTVPAPAGVLGGAQRTVPFSSTVAALCARADALGNPNRAAAGRDFPLQYASGFVLDVGESDRETLLDTHAVNVGAEIYGVLELDGFQTGRDLDPDDPYWQANCSRARMWLKAQAQAVGRPYDYRPIDGQGHLAHALKSDLDGVCLGLYAVDGLYGDTPQEAFATSVGATVNTTATASVGELHGVVEARLSLHAKAVFIDLVSVPVTGRVSTAA
jgi:hypothetical protein